MPATRRQSLLGRPPLSPLLAVALAALLAAGCSMTQNTSSTTYTDTSTTADGPPGDGPIDPDQSVPVRVFVVDPVVTSQEDETTGTVWLDDPAGQYGQDVYISIVEGSSLIADMDPSPILVPAGRQAGTFWIQAKNTGSGFVRVEARVGVVKKYYTFAVRVDP